MAYVRTVETASGATAVQIVWSSRRGSRSIEHLGSAHDGAELAALKAAAAERLSAGQAVLDLGVAGPSGSEPLPITSSPMTHLWDGLCAAYRVLGFQAVAKGDNVFRDLMLARIIEPTSKIDAARVLSEVGLAITVPSGILVPRMNDKPAQGCRTDPANRPSATIPTAGERAWRCARCRRGAPDCSTRVAHTCYAAEPDDDPWQKHLCRLHGDLIFGDHAGSTASHPPYDHVVELGKPLRADQPGAYDYDLRLPR